MTDALIVHAHPEGSVIDVRVVPRAARTGLAGYRDGALLVRLTAPPVEGAANTELIELLADLFDLPRRSVSLVAGAKSRRKRILVKGLSPAKITLLCERLTSSSKTPT